jgi:hypothetical protein
MNAPDDIMTGKPSLVMQDNIKVNLLKRLIGKILRIIGKVLVMLQIR